jgi:hypothetical protein
VAMSRNYTDAETKELIESYLLNPTLEMVTELSVRFRKTRKSIISKLSKEGVYRRKVYTSKSGDIPITKVELVSNIEESLGKKFNQLDKAPKATLNLLDKAVTQLQNDFDVLLAEYDRLNSEYTIKKDMKKI